MKTQKLTHIISVFLILFLLILTSCEESVKPTIKKTVEVSLATAPPATTAITQVSANTTTTSLGISWTAGNLEPSQHLAKTGTELTPAQVSYKIYVVKKDVVSKSAEQIKAEPDKVIDVPPEETNATISGLETATIYMLVIESINMTDINQNSLSIITELSTADTEIIISLLGNADNLHQSIRDTIMPNNTVIATITELTENTAYTFTFGDATGTKTSIDRKIEITKGDLLPSTTAVDGTELHLSEGSNDVLVATYKPFEIYSWQDLQAMRLNLTGSYTLINDITFPEAGTGGFPANGFKPVGFDTDDTPGAGGGNPAPFNGNDFNGSLDGTNPAGGVYSIYGLRIERSGKDYAGLFGQISSNSIIENLKVINADVIARQHVGVIAGLVDNAKIINVGIENSTVHGTDLIGGIAGRNLSGEIKGYASNITATGTIWVSGLVGYNYGTGATVIGYATGTMTGEGSVGGLIGQNANNAIAIGYAQGVISGTRYVGGLIGSSDSSSTGYARVKIIRSNNAFDNFGLLAGKATSIASGYHSVSESSVSEPANGIMGTSITMSTTTPQTTFTTTVPAFDFTNHWTWVGDGLWPAINIGTIKPAASQPITPVFIATAPPAATAITQVSANTTTSTLGISWTAGVLAENHVSNIGIVLTSTQVPYKIYAVVKGINARTSAQVKADATANMGVAAGTLNVTISSLDPATEYEIIVEAINSTDTDVTSLSDVATFSTN